MMTPTYPMNESCLIDYLYELPHYFFSSHFRFCTNEHFFAKKKPLKNVITVMFNFKGKSPILSWHDNIQCCYSGQNFFIWSEFRPTCQNGSENGPLFVKKKSEFHPFEYK